MEAITRRIFETSAVSDADAIVIRTAHRQRLDDAGRAALREVAPEIVMEFRGEHNRKLSTRKEMRWGAKGSFSLVIAGSKDGLWFDHEIGRGGDIIEFIKIERGCSFVEALDHAAQYVSKLRNGLYSSRPVSRPTLWQTVDSDDEKRIEQALGIWCEARPLTATLAETYLRSRCIEVPGEALDALRFHPRCPWWVGTRLAMVALIRDIITDEPIGIHRTALTADGRKLDRPKLLGPTAGGAIKLSGDYVVGELTIAEGIETALSAAQLNFGPVWSATDAGGIAQFPVLPEIERLTIIVDHDVNGVGQKAAGGCRARWAAAGRHVRTVMAVTPGYDLNDVLRERTGRLRQDSASNLTGEHAGAE
jgi:putative DNA primase/helicase